MFIRGCTFGLLLLLAFRCALAQDALIPGAVSPDALIPTTGAQSTTALSTPSVSEKWDFFVSETATPLLLVGVVANATTSQLTRSAPLYGKHFFRKDAFLKRAGATLGDTLSENFFSDFLLASAFHEDTRYVRRGPSHAFGRRIAYAISRAVITRTDSGDGTFNWANVVGCAMSAGLSNAYYPDVSRTPSVAMVNWGTNVAGAGLSNLMPELGPDVGHWMKRHLLHHH
jgi:hypothetical protein